MGAIKDDKGEGVRKALVGLLKALDAEEAVVVKQQRLAAQPKPHRFELRPAG